MGKLILCSGSRTKKPYGFTSTGVRVYSVEELCHYLYHHVYFIEEDLLSDSLIDWIKNELKLPERADKLQQLRDIKADIKLLVTVILCSSDYYTEYEIKSLLKQLDDIIGMPLIKRNCIKAADCLRNNQFNEAVTEYENVLNSKEALEMKPKEYGDILHNLAVAKVHLTGLSEAEELFYQAYERNQREESLKQYLYCLQLRGKEDDYKKAVIEYQVSDKLVEEIRNFLELKNEEAINSERMQQVNLLRQKKTQGQMNEFYHKTNEIIEFWENRVRQI
ncbi:MAG: hypothetical protein WBI07_19440 [Mobilitalea sp.]